MVCLSQEADSENQTTEYVRLCWKVAGYADQLECSRICLQTPFARHSTRAAKGKYLECSAKRCLHKIYLQTVKYHKVEMATQQPPRREACCDAVDRSLVVHDGLLRRKSTQRNVVCCGGQKAQQSVVLPL